MSGSALRGAVVVLLAGAAIGVLYKVKSDQTYLARPIGIYWKWGTRDPALQEAIDSGNAVAFARRLREVAKADIRPTFLTFLAQKGRASCLQAAIDSGWSPDGDRRDGAPLEAAVGAGHFEAASVLLANHARLDLSRQGDPLLCLAATQKDHALDLVKLLFQYGAKIECYRYLDPTRLGRAPGPPVRVKANPLGAAISARNADVAKFLIEHGANPDDGLINAEGLQAHEGSLAFLRLLLAKGADPNGNGANGHGLVAWYAIAEEIYVGRAGADPAWRYDATEATKLLLEHGARPDGVGSGYVRFPLPGDRQPLVKGTALFFQAAHGNADCVKLLLAHGADPLKKASNGQTPLDVATGDCKAILQQAIRSKEKSRLVQ